MSTSIAKLLRHPAASTQSLESVALLLAGAVLIVVAPISWLFFRDGEWPISGPGSLGQAIAVTSAVVAAAVFVFGRAVVSTRAGRAGVTDRAERRGRLRWFDVAALAIAHAVIALLGWTGLASVLSLSFIDAVVFSVPAAALTGVAVALTAYVVFLSSVHMNPMMLSLVLAVFLVLGALASMLSASDPHWWQMNLSSLGMTDDLSALAFNLTLIIAGVLVTTIAHYAVSSIAASTPKAVKGRRKVTGMLALLGILLACVGVFPVDEYLQAHNLAATGMAIVFTVLVFALPRWLPAVPRPFIILGYVDVAIIVVMAAFFVNGYYNLTAVELVVAVLVFSWVIVFLRNPGEATPIGRDEDADGDADAGGEADHGAAGTAADAGSDAGAGPDADALH